MSEWLGPTYYPSCPIKEDIRGVDFWGDRKTLIANHQRAFLETFNDLKMIVLVPGRWEAVMGEI